MVHKSLPVAPILPDLSWPALDGLTSAGRGPFLLRRGWRKRSAAANTTRVDPAVKLTMPGEPVPPEHAGRTGRDPGGRRGRAGHGPSGLTMRAGFAGGAANVIFVADAQKLVPSLEAALPGRIHIVLVREPTGF